MVTHEGPVCDTVLKSKDRRCKSYSNT